MSRTGRPVTTPTADNPVSELRRARGWSQAETARQLGISRQSVSDIENGKMSPSKTVLMLIEHIKKAP